MPAHWRKSTYSADTNTCVEVAYSERFVGLRDSKNPGPRLTLPAAAWHYVLAISSTAALSRSGDSAA
jgi:hypothetical protein